MSTSAAASHPWTFRDRREAGRLLAARLADVCDSGTIVVGLLRGGIPVAWEIAAALHTPLAPLAVRKLGVPGHEEYAMGAIASGGGGLLDHNLIRQLRITPEQVRAITERETRELHRRETAYGVSAADIPIADRTVMLVDDGMATGATAYAAIRTMTRRGARRLIVAAPVAPASVCHGLLRVADAVAVLSTPSPFVSVGDSYQDFDQLTDEAVLSYLRTAPG